MCCKKATAHIDRKASNVRHQSQKSVRDIFVRIPQHQKGYLIYISSSQNIFRHMTVYLTKTILVPWHTCHVHIQSHLRRNQRSCTLHIIHHLKNIITFSQFEEGDLLEKERNLVK